ncbi:MAG TPA: SSI family serine proteinase inhibitor [Kineosporiaceae bacterium]|nr:SSI family serine proteinase inhibitor [Kineosporiaceae bacterium]
MSTVRLTTPALFATVLLLLAGCGGSGSTSGGSVTPASSGPPSGTSSSSGTPQPSGSPSTTSPKPPASGSVRAAAGSADLTIVLDDGAGTTTTWHLTCSPAGGNHPDPARACAVLAEHGDTALPPVPPGRMCTQVFGGAQTAHITGTWRGKAVDARLSRTNGCEIARWQALLGLLPTGDR